MSLYKDYMEAKYSTANYSKITAMNYSKQIKQRDHAYENSEINTADSAMDHLATIRTLQI